MTAENPDGTTTASPERSDGADPVTTETDRAPSGDGAGGLSSSDRAAALKAGSTPIPRKFVLWVIVAFAVLGVGGVIGEKLIGNAGVSSLISTPVTTLAGTGISPTGPSSGPAPADPAPPNAPSIKVSPSTVIGLTRLSGKMASGVDLQSQSGSHWTLAGARGKVVVLTFFNSECDDICPVLAKEIIDADRLLGPKAKAVDFAVVNSDPLDTSLSPAPAALTQTGLSNVANLVFLDDPLDQLVSVWKHYGVTVTMNNTDLVITHSDVMYFIDQSGRLRYGASPFANEDTLGLYSLQTTTIRAFARGVADTVTTLLRGAS